MSETTLRNCSNGAISNDGTMSVIEAIARWSDERTGFTVRSRELATYAIIDTLACMHAGASDYSTDAVLRAFADQHFDDAPAAVVCGRRANASTAALVNATAAHALDYDDNFVPGMCHASAVLVPALLALGQQVDADGAGLVDAYLVGLQCQAFVGEGIGFSHYTAGWHGTSTVGMIGTAAAAASLLGLGQVGVAWALSNAVSLASGTKGQFGSPIKPLHAGFAARNGVDAAVLAASGMHGRLDILEGPQGFRDLFGGSNPGSWDTDKVINRTDHVIESWGVWPKQHPCCGSTHLIVDAVLDLQEEYRFTSADVVGVDATVLSANARNLPYSQPKDEMQARFSMQYCVDRALDKGHLSLADFTPQFVRANADAQQLSRIRLKVWPPEKEASLLSENRILNRVSVTLRDGRVLVGERTEARGTNADPFSDTARRLKFLDCCSDVDEREDLYEKLIALGDREDLHFLQPLFAG